MQYAFILLTETVFVTFHDLNGCWNLICDDKHKDEMCILLKAWNENNTSKKANVKQTTLWSRDLNLTTTRSLTTQIQDTFSVNWSMYTL